MSDIEIDAGDTKQVSHNEMTALTILQCVKMLCDAGSRSMLVQFDAVPMKVRITLEFPRATTLTSHRTKQ